MMILEKGVLKRKRGTHIEPKDYYMTFIDHNHMDAILELQDAVVKDLISHDIFEPDSFQFIQEELIKKAFIIGVFSEEKLIAYRFITFPEGDAMNLGEDLNLPKEELRKVAHLETTIVHPEYRGNGLQRKTLEHGIEEIRRKGYRHLCTTISPKNYFSINNIMSASLVIKELKYKYGSKPDGSDAKLRYILHRDLSEKVRQEYDKIIVFDNHSIEEQMNALKAGFVGFKVFPMEEKVAFGFHVKYGMHEDESEVIA